MMVRQVGTKGVVTKPPFLKKGERLLLCIGAANAEGTGMVSTPPRSPR